LGSAFHAACLADVEVSDAELIVQSGSNEHYTPAKYIEAAREVLGEIDLDPASCKLAQKTVKATTFFDKKTDGLVQEWRGRVFLNPPYGALTGKFVKKLIDDILAHRVTAATHPGFKCYGLAVPAFALRSIASILTVPERAMARRMEACLFILAPTGRNSQKNSGNLAFHAFGLPPHTMTRTKIRERPHDKRQWQEHGRSGIQRRSSLRPL
jgi:hypothetical protein